MKNNKIIARIGAIVACVLLVCSLAIPAFADTRAMSAAQIKAFAFNAWVHSVQSLINPSFDYFLARTTLTPEDEIFDYDIISTSHLTSRILIDYTTIGSESSAASAGTIGSYEYVISLCFDDCNIVHNTGYIELLQGSIGGVYDVKIRFYEDNSTDYLLYEFDYDGVMLNGYPEIQLKRIKDYTGADVIAYDIISPDDVVYSSVTIATKNFEETNMMLLATLLFGSSQTETTYPKAYYQAYATAFDADSYTDAYNDGYEQARNEITSGEFGKNMIGTIISAPFDALRNFTLIEWELSNGGTVTITLATIVSAGIGIAVFVWFLKMFAGG